MADAEVNILIDIDQRLQGIESTVDGLEQVERQATTMGDALRTGFGVEIVSRFTDALARVPGILTGAIQRGIDFASAVESAEVRMSTLLGSTEAAAKRVEELKEFSKSTPFQFDDILQASASLESLTQGALSSGDGLRLVGDAAAAQKQPITELSTQVGRLFDGLQTGRAVGEPLARLQELGLVSGEVRAKIEELQAAGAKGNEVWQVAAQQLLRFEGSMAKGSETFEGLVSTLNDALDGALAKIAEPLFKELSDSAKELTENIENIETDDIEALVEAIADAVEMGTDLTKWAIENNESLIAVAKGAALVGSAFAAMKLANFVATLGAGAAAWLRSATAITAETNALRANTAAQGRNAVVRKTNTAATTAASGKRGLGGLFGKGAAGRIGNLTKRLGGLAKTIARIPLVRGGLIGGAFAGGAFIGNEIRKSIEANIPVFTRLKERTEEAQEALDDFQNSQREAIDGLRERLVDLSAEKEIEQLKNDILEQQKDVRQEITELEKEGGVNAEAKIRELQRSQFILGAFVDKLDEEGQAIVANNQERERTKQILAESSAAQEQSKAKLEEYNQSLRKSQQEARTLDERINDIKRSSKDTVDEIAAIDERINDIRSGRGPEAIQLDEDDTSEDLVNKKKARQELIASLRQEQEALQAQAEIKEQKLSELDEQRTQRLREQKAIVDELRALDAEAAGETERAEQIRREIELRQRTIELANQLNLEQEQAAQLAEREIVARERIAQAAEKEREAKQAARKAEKAEEARAATATELRILEARASGNDRLANRLENISEIRKDAERIAERENRSMEEATRIALRMFRLEQRINGERANRPDVSRLDARDRATVRDRLGNPTLNPLERRSADLQSGVEATRRRAAGLPPTAVTAQAQPRIRVEDVQSTSGSSRVNSSRLAKVKSAGDGTQQAVDELGDTMVSTLTDIQGRISSLSEQIQQNLNQ